MRRKPLSITSWGVGAACLAMALYGEDEEAARIVVATDIEVRPALEEAIEEFARESDCIVEPRWTEGESPSATATGADVLLWQDAASRGEDVAPLVDPGTARLVGQKRLAILTRHGTAHGIEKLSDLGTAGIRVALASEAWGSLRRATAAALERAGAGAFRPDAAIGVDGAAAMVDALREGRVDAAVGWDVLEGLSPCEIDALPLPREVSAPVAVRAGVIRGTKRVEDARSFVDFLVSPVGEAVLGRHGYGVVLHDAGAAAYDAFVERRLRETYPLTARRMINESGITRGICIDLGCGTGQLDVELARISDLQIIGLDIDPEMVEIARRRVEEAGLSERVRFVVGDVHELPFDAEHADLVVSRGSLPFWTDRVEALREIHRVLTPGGFALLGGRYLFTPARFRLCDDELGRAVEESGIPNARVVTDRGQWVEIRGAEWKPPSFDFRGRMSMLAGRVVVDYGITEGTCLVIANRFTGLEVELARRTSLSVVSVLGNEGAVAEAEKAVADAGLGGRIEIVAADAHALPHGDGAVDLVVSVAALPFWGDRGAVFREVHRVLRSGGVAFLGGRYVFMPEWRKVPTAELRKTVEATGLPGMRVVEDMGQWVEIRKPRR